MNVPILYEDDVLLVIDKPSGIVVNRAQSVKESTVQDWVESRNSLQPPKSNPTLPPLTLRGGEEGLRGGEGGVNEDDFRARSGIVHRIDKETSGILLIAKTPQAFFELQRQFKEREVKKTYLALVHGRMVPEEGEIRAPVGRLPWNSGRFGILPGGKEAVTRYKVLQVLQGTPLLSKGVPYEISLVELYPETGRTHQIRVHLKYINHPIVGDYLYAGRKTSRDDRAHGAPRVMLHAWKISFTHPVTHKILAFESPIPDDIGRLIHHGSQ